MKEHPIIFSTDMVKVILDGRKTQTRRVIKPQLSKFDVGILEALGDKAEWGSSPYGQVGDRLWVRETCYKDTLGHWRYKADDKLLAMTANYTGREVIPSIHMPRWASRITLEITGIRVERVQDITEKDTKAEGVTRPPNYSLTPHYKEWFKYLWDKLNYKRGYGWDENPWVWVIEFKKAG